MTASLRSFWHAVAAAGSLKDWPLGLSVLDDPDYRVCPPQARVWKMPAQTVVERCAGDSVTFDSPVAAAWVAPATGAAILFVVCPIHRSASRSFWAGAYPAAQALADRDEQLHSAVCQLCLAA